MIDGIRKILENAGHALSEEFIDALKAAAQTAATRAAGEQMARSGYKVIGTLSNAEMGISIQERANAIDATLASIREALAQCGQALETYAVAQLAYDRLRETPGSPAPARREARETREDAEELVRAAFRQYAALTGGGNGKTLSQLLD